MVDYPSTAPFEAEESANTANNAQDSAQQILKKFTIKQNETK